MAVFPHACSLYHTIYALWLQECCHTEYKFSCYVVKSNAASFCIETDARYLESSGIHTQILYYGQSWQKQSRVPPAAVSHVAGEAAGRAECLNPLLVMGTVGQFLQLCVAVGSVYGRSKA